PEHRDPLARPERAERACAGADRVGRERKLALGGGAERHRPRQQTPGRLEHEELSRRAGLDPTPLEPKQRVRAYGLGADDPEPLTPQCRFSRGGRALSPPGRWRSRGRPRRLRRWW